MAILVPKSTTDADWLALKPNCANGVRLNKDETVFLRLGPAQGIYLAVLPASVGALIHQADFETGTQSLIGKLTENGPTSIGRTAQSPIKIMHAIVSRQHVEFSLKGNILMVRDLGSTNGTLLHKDSVHFDIDAYLETHSLDKAEEGTLDSVHEQFGPEVNDFLRHYLQQKDNGPK